MPDHGLCEMLCSKSPNQIKGKCYESVVWIVKLLDIYVCRGLEL